MSTQALSEQLSIEDFAAELRKFPESAFDHTEQIIRFLQSTPVAPDTLTPFLTWDRQHYTRNLIDKTSLYELIAVCWEIGQNSSVHNHRDQHCWMAVPIGRLRIENYRVISQDIEQGNCVYNPREFNQRAVSLHVYSRPFDSCVVYSPEQGTCGVINLHYNTEYGKPVQ
jgi:cysteine dioxygenase